MSSVVSLLLICFHSCFSSVCSAPHLQVRSICPVSEPELQTACLSSFTVPALHTKCIWLSNVIHTGILCWMLIKHKRSDKQIFHKPLLSRTSAGEPVWCWSWQFSHLLWPIWACCHLVYDVMYCDFSDQLSPYLEES